MGMISKKGLGMHMGGVSTAKLQKEAHKQATNDDPFSDGYDPFASNDSTSSSSLETMLKDTFGTDFDGLNKNMKPSDEEPIKKLKFGNGVTMTMLKLPQAPTPEPEQVVELGTERIEQAIQIDRESSAANVAARVAAEAQRAREKRSRQDITLGVC